MANEFTDIRVGVDWSNKGVVCMGVKPTDPRNLISNALFYETHPTWSSGAFSKTYLGGLDYPIAGGVRWGWTTNTVGEQVWFFRDSGTTRSLTVTPNTTYTMTVYLRISSLLTPDILNIEIMGWNGASWSVIRSTTDVAIISSYSVLRTSEFGEDTFSYQIPFTTGASHTRLAVRMTNSRGTSTTYYIYGFMLVAGNYPSPLIGGSQILYWNCYQDDPLSLYDDITDYLISADYSLGRQDWEQALPSEGTATIVLKNSDHRFSPEHADYAYSYVPNRRILIERDVSKAGIHPIHQYNLAWSGWTQSLNPTWNEYGDRTATLEALQGWFNLGKVTVTPAILTSVPSGRVFYEAISNGYELPTNPAFGKVGYSKVGHSWLVQPLVYVPNTYNAGETLEVIGLYWNPDDTALDVIEDVANLENNWVFMNRYGSFTFIPAATMSAATPNVTLDSTSFQDMEYQYSTELWTAVKYSAHYQPATPAIPANAFRLIKEPVTITIPANTTLNYQANYDYNSDYSVNEKSYGAHSTELYNAFNKATGASVTITAPGFGGSVIIGYVGNQYDERSTVWAYAATYYFINTNAFDVEVVLDVYGYGWKTTFDGMVVAYDNTTTARYGYTENVLDENQYALNESLISTYLQRRYLRYGTPRGWFPRAQIIVSNYVVSGIVNNLAIGRVWRLLSEPQTGVVNKDMVIIGEDARWTPQYFEKTIYSSPRF